MKVETTLLLSPKETLKLLTALFEEEGEVSMFIEKKRKHED